MPQPHPIEPAISIERLPANFDVEYLTDELLNNDRHARGHFFVTLIHTQTGEEKAIDILLSENSFARLSQVLRQHISYQFEIFEWIDIDMPF